jgi:hypothetical protein
VVTVRVGRSMHALGADVAARLRVTPAPGAAA